MIEEFPKDSFIFVEKSQRYYRELPRDCDLSSHLTLNIYSA
jgi:hypothetical protein